MRVLPVSRGGIDSDYSGCLRDYAKKVKSEFGGEFAASEARFPKSDSRKLIEKFERAVDAVLSKGVRQSGDVHAAHNEICVASRLLDVSRLRVTSLEYEPRLPGCAKTIDFRASTDEGQVVYFDVKTIQPERIDRWKKLEELRARGGFPPNVGLTLSWKDLPEESRRQNEQLVEEAQAGGVRDIGGEIWHEMFAARGKMLQYALELEGKIRECGLSTSGAQFVLVLCGDGSRWDEDELEDFAWFYRSGRHRQDDPFSNMEGRDITAKGIRLDQSVTGFACLFRKRGSLHAHRWNPSVQAPASPLP
jgi:hypothetical protein